MAKAKPLRALICDGDVWIRRTLGTIAEEAGFEVVAEAANVIAALNEQAYARPSLVVATFDSLVMNPMSILGELAQGTGTPVVVLVSPDQSTEERARAGGAFGVARQGDAAALAGVLAQAKELLTTGNQRKRIERRLSSERREKQVWSKVTSQRRDGDDRRGTGRRGSA